MRGKLATASSRAFKRGITPADAGKTYRGGFTYANPRGSPPRMRGKPVVRPVFSVRLGITPADAGKTHCQLYFDFQY